MEAEAGKGAVVEAEEEAEAATQAILREGRTRRASPEKGADRRNFFS